jgi:hypothetical protein
MAFLAEPRNREWSAVVPMMSLQSNFSVAFRAYRRFSNLSPIDRALDKKSSFSFERFSIEFADLRFVFGVPLSYVGFGLLGVCLAPFPCPLAVVSSILICIFVSVLLGTFSRYGRVCFLLNDSRTFLTVRRKSARFGNIFVEGLKGKILFAHGAVLHAVYRHTDGGSCQHMHVQACTV